MRAILSRARGVNAQYANLLAALPASLVDGTHLHLLYMGAGKTVHNKDILDK